ncbi:hypothetical protein OOT08_13750, partial [Leucobacter sp. M11]|nr:hypothetical protein [Leucobacter sp. M11]
MTANPGSSVPYLTQRDHSSAAPKRRAGAPATAAAALMLAAALTLLGATAAAAAPLRTEPVRTEPLRAETPSTAIDQRSGAEGELRRLELAPGDRLAQPFAPLGSGAAAKITVWAEAGSPDDFTIALHAVRGGAVDPEPMPGGTGETVTLPNTVAPKSSPGAGGETVPGPEVGEGFLPRQLSLADGPQLDAGTAYAIVVTAGGQGARTVFPATASEVAGASALHAPGGGDWAEAPGPSRLLTEVQLWGEAEGEAGSGTPPPTPGADPGEPPVAVPEAPALRCGAAPALELPAVTGVRYDEEQSGTALIATASPEPGFVFPTDARTSWRFLLTV